MPRNRIFDRKQLLGAVAASALLAAAGPGHALTINAFFGSSITTDPNAAAIEASINSALGFYSQFTNAVTVNIGFQSVTTGLGGSNTGLYGDYYSSYVNQMQIDALTHPGNAVLNTALQPANLAAGNQADLIFGTSAEMRALGYDTPGFVAGFFDGIISLNTSIMNFTNTTDPSLYPGTPVIQHEVDEVLGVGGSGTLVDQPFGLGNFEGSGLSYMGEEDLYRYAAPGVASFTTDPTATSYFSYDGGATPVDYFNQNGLGDYADWAKTSCSTPENVQDWAGCPGVPQFGLNLGSPEVTALLAAGYDLTPSVPEPSAWALMIAGFGLAGAALRRRRPALT
ncbi:MAG: NF038122 family metalloprotease [Phenylobacterium sp.]